MSYKMKVLLSIVVLITLTDVSKADADMCGDDSTVNGLPGGILGEFLSILITGTIPDFFGCPDDIEIDENEVKLYLFTRDNPNTPILINKNDPKIDTSKPIKIIVPSWLCNVTDNKFPDVINAYLKAYDCNVIGVDWTKYSLDLYVNSFCYVPLIGKVIGKFLCDLQKNHNVDLSTVHVVGHSMGGQLSGFIGQETQAQCNTKIGRITGLDPAGPLYQGIGDDRRLSKKDGTFVDVIHTNQKVFGYYGSCGTVDFYVNCGMRQPGCLEVAIEDPGSILALPIRMVSCNHLRAVEYFTESILSDNFRSTSCRKCPHRIGRCRKDSMNKNYINMGEHLTKKPRRVGYWCPTNEEPPFAKG